MRILTLASTLLIVGCSSCSSSDSGGDNPQDTGSSDTNGGTDTATATDAPATDTNTDAGACGETLTLGAGIAATTETGTPPTATGGSIADGVYTLSSIQLYGATAPAGKSKITLKIEESAKHYQAVSWDDSAPKNAYSCGAIASATPKINFSGMGSFDGYSATPTTLVLMKKVGGGAVTNVLTYTKS